MSSDELSAAARALIEREAPLDEPTELELEQAQSLVYRALGLPLPPGSGAPSLNSPQAASDASPAPGPNPTDAANPVELPAQLAGSTKVAPLLSSTASGLLLTASLFLAANPPALLHPKAISVGDRSWQETAASAAPLPEATLVPSALPTAPPDRAISTVRKVASAPSAPSPVSEAAPVTAREREEEALLVAAAEAQLRAGHFASALALFERHLAKYPSGMLRPETQRGRIHALCASGRRQEGREALASLSSGSKPSARLDALMGTCQVSAP